MRILDDEELKISQLREKQRRADIKAEAEQYVKDRDELVGYELPEIQDKVTRSYQALQGKTDDELKDLTEKLRADWAGSVKKSVRPDGKMKADRIGHRDPTDVIQKQRCRQAVREYVEREYTRVRHAEALVITLVLTKASIQEKRFLQGQDLKDSKIVAKQKLPKKIKL